ncbi:ABC transporter ATP-binding protein [Corynebacterium cystitidis]|uniref:Teichoic acid transport system ATP-binding protein n=1 Tax=Corynebacterium cystitidis DSM 20524 TaxID=1121357 RepID=A0A1H9WAN2_9CORY|nr:ABC transporter ATP-binding protein [Corynebacterium cystitidis]WJY82944.1 Teichoic acids export ATP-binding protein TagH [Corynebacterium cystitidis DSM 20524]SES30884.1 teichoic acid transport system ATP-binding protein [Corynebacterium cystitidis DSM 20524]SNV68762.1 ABC transporter ATP-binding protein [Corynebacterium cystitidis]
MSGSPNSANPEAIPRFEYISDATVAVQNVSKRYVISGSQSTDAAAISHVGKKTVVNALHDVSLVARAGDSVGIIGLNGSGKSTLLRMISGGEAVTSGQVFVRSQPTLLGVTPALQRDLSGEQNIYLGCLAVGMSPTEAKAQIPIISEWTELGEAIHRPMATYSSGMTARLGFAISTAIEPEILLIDEALSTGDAAFGAKAEERMQKLLDKAGNLFLVSHSIGTVEKLCSRSIWIYRGKIIADGTTDDVCPLYHEWARRMGKDDKGPAYEFLDEVRANYTPPFVVFDNAKPQ